MKSAVWAAMVLVGAARLAHADAVRLETTSDGCDLESLRAAVVALAPEARIAEDAEGVIRADAVGLTVHVQIDADRQHGTRDVTGATCEELVENTAVVIAMGLPPAGAPPPAPPSAPEHPPEEMVASRVEASVSADVFAGAAITTRGSHTQMQLGARWRGPDHSVGAALRRDGDESIAIDRMGQVQVGRTDLAFTPCLEFGSLATCALGGFGVITGAGVGLLHPRSAVSPIAFLGAGIRWEHALAGAVRLSAQVEADALLTSVAFEVDQMPVWKTSRLEATGGIAVVAHFP